MKLVLTIIFVTAIIVSSSASETSNFISDNSEKNEKPVELSARKPYPVFIKCFANTKDIMFSAGGGIYLFPEYMVSIRSAISMRPYEKTVFVEKEINKYYQLKESRYGIELVLDYIFMLSNRSIPLGIFFAAGGGVSTATFDGIDLETENSVTPVFRAGIQAGEVWYLRLGYEYYKIPHVPYNHLMFELGIRF